MLSMRDTDYVLCVQYVDCNASEASILLSCYATMLVSFSFEVSRNLLVNKQEVFWQ